jgi:DNA uptake protein ComE-like DNA-binding protein
VEGESRQRLRESRVRLQLSESHAERVERIATEAERHLRAVDDAYAEAQAADAAERVDLSSAGFEQLRALGLSVTQATRVLRWREQAELTKVDDLDRIPGLPNELRAELKRRAYVGAAAS